MLSSLLFAAISEKERRNFLRFSKKMRPEKFIKMFTDMVNKGCNVDFDVVFQFVCQLYAQNNATDVNEARCKKLMNMTEKPDQVSVD